MVNPKLCKKINIFVKYLINIKSNVYNIMLQDHMKPVDVGAPRLIPQGNLSDHPASYAGMRKALDAVQTSKVTTRGTAYPGFVPGYTTKGLEGEWQTTTIGGTSAKK